MPTTQTYGKKVTVAQGDFVTLATLRQIGYSERNDPLGTALWIFKFGAWMGRSGATTPTVQLAAWNTANAFSDTPTTRAGYSVVVSPGVLMDTAAGGASYEANANTVFLALAGKKYALGLANTVAGVSIADAPAVDTHFLRTITTQPPNDPFAHTSEALEGQLCVWMVGDINEAPLVPTTLAPITGATNVSVTPTIAGDFRDNNETLSTGADNKANEKLKNVQIIVTRNSDGAVMWNYLYAASASEQTARRFSIVYAGTALAPGTAYSWKGRVSDQADVFSAYTALQSFTTNPGGTVTITAGTPTGKQETVSPTPFTGVWTHPTALSTDQVQVQIKSGAIVVRSMTALAQTVANNGTISVTWAQTAFAALDWGQAYTYEIRGRDTLGSWSPWSDGRAFTTNAQPTTPANLTPNSGAYGTAPKLTFIMSDADDTVASGLSGQVQIYDARFVHNWTFTGGRQGWRDDGFLGAGVVATRTYDAAVSADTGGSGSGKVGVTTNPLGVGAALNSWANGYMHPVVGGSVQIVGGSLRTDNLNITGRVEAHFYDASKAYISSVGEAYWAPGAINTFYARSIVVTAPSNASYMRVGYYVHGVTAGILGNVWGDGIFAADGARWQRNAVLRPGTTDTWDYQTTLGVNEVQRLTFGGTVTGGTYTITVPANDLGVASTTTAIQWNATAATVQGLLEALINVGNGMVLVTGGPGPGANFDLTFVGALGGLNVAQVTIASSLTGTAPTLTPSTITAGVEGDLPQYATYRWRAAGNDGTLVSAWSGIATFQYALVPVVTITAPTAEQVLTTDAPLITWTTTGQVSYRVKIYKTVGNVSGAADLTQLVYDSGSVVSGTSSHAVPSGYLKNATFYQLLVEVTNSAPVTGSSVGWGFSLSYTPPVAPTAVLAQAIKIGADREPTAIQVTWGPVATPIASFSHYEVWRTPVGSPASAAVLLAEITNVGQGILIDYIPASGVEYAYAVAQLTRQGSELTASAAPESRATVTIDSVVLVAISSPATLRAELLYYTTRSHAFRRTDRYQDPLGGGVGRTMRARAQRWESGGDFPVVTDDLGTGSDKIAALRALVETGGTICYRDARGARRFVTITAYEEEDLYNGNWDASLSFREEYAVEGGAVMAVILPAAQNLITNPSVETADIGVFGADTGITRTTARVNDRAYAGSWAKWVEVTANTGAANAQVLRYYQDVSLTGVATGTPFNCAVHYYTTNANLVGHLYTEFFNGATYLSTAELPPVYGLAVNQWHKVAQANLVTPATTTLARVFFEVVSAASGNLGHTWLDAMDARTTEQYDTYVDGSLGTGYGWNGAAHASTSYRLATARQEIGFRGGVTTASAELWRMTQQNVPVEDITARFIGGSVDVNIDRPVKTMAKLTLDQPDVVTPLVDYLAPYVVLEDEDGTITRTQLGLYAIDLPTERYDPPNSEGALDGRDLTWLLAQAAFSDTYSVAAATNYVTAVITLLASVGITRYAIPATATTLPAAMSWKPGTTRLKAANDLLSAIGYYTLYAHNDGTLASMAYRELSRTEPAVRHTVGDDSAVIGPITRTPDTTRLANVVIVVKDNPTGTALTATRRNDNPASPTSTVALGAERTRVVLDGQLANQAAADALADRLVEEWSSVYVTLALQARPDPARQPHETLYLDFAGEPSLADLAGQYWMRGYGFSFAPDPRPMTYQLSRVERWR